MASSCAHISEDLGSSASLKSLLARVERLSDLQASFASEHASVVAVLRGVLCGKIDALAADDGSADNSDAVPSGDVTSTAATTPESPPSPQPAPTPDHQRSRRGSPAPQCLADQDDSQLVFPDQVLPTTPKSVPTTPKSRSRLSSHSRSTVYACEDAPQRGFVVNTQRLITSQETLNLLHEFVKSTAIAALTLVAGGSYTQFRNTMAFLLSIFLLYADHERRFDRLDIRDLQHLAHHFPGLPSPENPNQILRAMETRTSCFERAARVCLHLTVLACLALTWLNISMYYRVKWSTIFADVFLTSDLRFDGTSSDDMEYGALQVIVLSVMYLLCAFFDLIRTYEAGQCMPTRADGAVWDVRQHGMPLRFRLFGLPSLWFTTKQVKSDLVAWINALYPLLCVREIFPEELALLAIEGEMDMRKMLLQTLKHAKFYDAREKACNDNMPLDIDVRFFSDDMQEDGMSFPGHFVHSALEYDTSPDEQTAVELGQRSHAVTEDGASLELQAISKHACQLADDSRLDFEEI